MTRHELFTSALLRARGFVERYPSEPAIQSILRQLEYLIAVEEGKRSDFQRLKEIIIGVLAMREIEVLDEGFAELLYSVDAEVDKMKYEKRLPVR